MMLSVLDCVVSNSRVTDQRGVKKDFEGSSHGLIKALFHYKPGGTEEKYKRPVRITGIPAEISTKHLRNTSLEHCCYSNLFSQFCSSLKSSSCLEFTSFQSLKLHTHSVAHAH
jgi:hypothetical protein